MAYFFEKSHSKLIGAKLLTVEVDHHSRMGAVPGGVAALGVDACELSSEIQFAVVPTSLQVTRVWRSDINR